MEPEETNYTIIVQDGIEVLKENSSTIAGEVVNVLAKTEKEIEACDMTINTATEMLSEAEEKKQKLVEKRAAILAAQPE